MVYLVTSHEPGLGEVKPILTLASVWTEVVSIFLIVFGWWVAGGLVARLVELIDYIRTPASA